MLAFYLLEQSAWAEFQYLPALWDSPAFSQFGLSPPFAGGAKMGDPQSSKKSFVLLKLAENALTVKTEYIEKSPIAASKGFSILDQTQVRALATSSLIDHLLNAEGEFGYTSFDAKSFADITDINHRLLRFGIRGSWSDISYGAEYHSVGKDFVNLAGPMILGDQEGGELWAQKAFGMFSVKAFLSDFTNNVAEDSASPRTTKLQAGTRLSVAPPSWPVFSLFYSTGLLATSKEPAEARAESGSLDSVGTSLYFGARQWDATLTSIYSQSSIKGRPAVGDGSSHFSSSRTQTDTPSFSLGVNYRPSILPVQMSTFGSYIKTKSADGYKNTDTFNLSTYLFWNLGQSAAGKNTLSLGTTYNRHLDAVAPTSSNQDLSVWLRLKIASY